MRKQKTNILFRQIAAAMIAANIIAQTLPVQAVEIADLQPNFSGGSSWGNLTDYTDLKKSYSQEFVEKLKNLQEQPELYLNKNQTETENANSSEELKNISSRLDSYNLDDVTSSEEANIILESIGKTNDNTLEILKKADVIQTYIDPQTKTETIANPNLVEKNEKLMTESTEYEISLARNSISGENSIAYQTSDSNEDSNNYSIGYRPLNVNPVEAQKLENKAIYENYWNGVDAVYTAKTDGLKEDLILKNQPDTLVDKYSSGYQGNNIWLFYYKLNLENAKPYFGEDKKIHFKDNNGADIAYCSNPYLIDNQGEISNKAYYDLITQDEFSQGYIIDENKFNSDNYESDLTGPVQTENDLTINSEVDQTTSNSAQIQSGSWWQSIGQAAEKIFESFGNIFGVGLAQENDQTTSSQNVLDNTTENDLTATVKIDSDADFENNSLKTQSEYVYLVLAVNTNNLSYPIDIDPTTYIFTTSNVYNTANGKLLSNNITDVKVYDTTLEPASNYARNKELKTTLSLNNTVGQFDNTSLTGYWSLDENNGTTLEDDTASASDGSIVNAATYTDGQINSGLAFNGTDQYAQIDDADKLGLDLSTSAISVWVNPTDLTDKHTILSKGSAGDWEYYLGTGDNGSVVFNGWQLSGSDHLVLTTGANAVKTNEWSMITVSLEESIAKLYINSKIKAETNVLTGNFGNGSANLEIGRGNDQTNLYYFAGKIDEIKIFNSFLSDNEVLNLYNNDRSKMTGWWKMEDDLTDKSGHNNPGTPTGTTYINDGKKGKALNLASGDEVDLGNKYSLSSQKNLSIETWVRTSTGGEIITKDNEYSLQICPNGKPMMSVFAGGAWQSNVGSSNVCTNSDSVAINDNTWHHLAGSYDGKYIRLFIDGRQASYYYIKGEITRTANTAIVGNGTYQGDIDELAIYNRNLSQDEFYSHYTNDYSNRITSINNFDNSIGGNEYVQLALDNIIVGQSGILHIKGTDYNNQQITENIKLRAGVLNRILSAKKYRSIEQISALDEYGNNSDQILSIAQGRLIAYSAFHDANWRYGVNKIDDKVTALWNFDEGNGAVVNDNSGGNNNGFLAGGNVGNWNYQRYIAINPATTIENYQIKINLDNSNFDYINARSDGGDIRFFDNDGKELSYWIESWNSGGQSVVWVKIPAANTSEVIMRYGNLGAASKSNGDNVFDLFDNFSGTKLDTAKWSVLNNDSYMIQNDKLIFASGKGAWSSNGITSKKNFNRSNLELNFDMKPISGNDAMFGWHDNGAGTSYTDLIYAYYIWSNTDLSVYEDSTSRYHVTTDPWVNGTTYKIKMPIKSTGGAKYSRSADGGLSYSQTYDSTYSTESPLRVGISNYNKDFEIDNLFVRKYSATEPTVSLGGLILSAESFASQGNWYDSNWQYRTQLYVNNSQNNYDLTDYQTLINVDGKILTDNSRLLSSAADLRFTDSDGTTILNQWLESGANTHATRSWIKIPTVTAKTTKNIFVYYGNVAAPSVNNYDNVFTKDFGETGLIGLWHMDEGSGTNLSDSSGRNINISMVNGPAWQGTDGGQWDGRTDVNFSTGKHLRLDGSDDYLQVPQNLVYNFGTNDWTISTWIKPNAITTCDEVWAQNNPYNFLRLSCSNASLWEFYNNGVQYVGPAHGMATGNWYYLVVTRKDNTVYLYQNNVLLWNFDVSTNPTNMGNAGWTIGDSSWGTENFNAYIDEFRVYDRSLTTNEIKSQYERRKYAPNGLAASVANQVDDSSMPDWSSSGKFGKALSFDGQSDFVQIPDDESLNPKNEFSVGAWVKPATMNGWVYSKPITFTPPTPLDNFQVKIPLSTTNFDYFNAKPDGSDLRFTDNKGNKIDYYIDNWNQQGISNVWVKVPKAETSKIYIYYGNSASASESNFNNVFTKDYGSDSYLKGMWHLDEGSGGNITDNSGNGHSGTITTATWQGSDGGGWNGKNSSFATGSHLGFNGTTDFVTLDDSPDWDFGTGDFSVSLWLKIPSNATSRSIIGNRINSGTDDHWNLEFHTTANRLEWHTSATIMGTSSTTVPVNQWAHVVLTRESGTDRFYINGVNTNSFADGNNYNNGRTLYIGKDGHATSGLGLFNGNMDEIRITKGRSLSAGEVKSLYERRLYGASSDPAVVVGSEASPSTANLYQKNITIDPATTVNNFVAKINLDSSNFDFTKARNDGEDIRFYDSAGNSLNYWIDEWGTNSVIYVNIPTSGMSNINMVYGNKQYATFSGCDGVFVKCDDFEDGQFDRNIWTPIRVGDTDWNEGVSDQGWLAMLAPNGKNMPDTAADAPMFLTSDNAGTDFEAKVSLKFDPTENNQQAGLIIYQDDNNYIQATAKYNNGQKIDFKIFRKDVPYSIGTVENDFTMPTILDLKIKKTAEQYKLFYKDHSSSSWTQHTAVINTDMPVQRTGLIAYSGSGASKMAYFDNFTIKPYQGESATSVGTEQGWNYKRIVNLSNGTSFENQDVKVILNTSNFNYSHAQGDGSDIRFYDDNFNKLPYWIESWNNTGTSTIWVKASYSGTNQINMYYGNSSAGSESNGNKVFTFFDDFNAETIDSSKWMNTGSFTQSGGNLTGGNTSNRLQSTTNFTGNYILETRHYTSTESSNGYMPAGWFDSTSNNYGVLFHPTNAWHTRSDSTWRSIGGLNYVFYWTKISLMAKGANSQAQIIRESDSATSTAYDNNGGLSNEKISLGKRYDDLYTDQIYSALWDWIAVRKFDPNAIEPTTSLSDEERWMYSKQINLSPATPVNDYQVRVVLNSGNIDYKNTLDDGADLRFYTTDGQKLNFWIERWDKTGNSVVWVKIPQSSTSAFKMYYGNPKAIDESNGQATFDFFEDFEDKQLDTGKWSWTREVADSWNEGINKDGWFYLPALQNSNMWESDNSAPVLLTNTDYASGNWEAAAQVRISSTENYQQAGLIAYESDQTHVQTMRGFNAGQKATFKVEQNDLVTVANDENLTSVNVDLKLNKVNDHYKMYYKNHSDFAYTQHASEQDATLTSQKLGLISYADNGASLDTFYDNFRIRKASTSEPVATFGSQQAAEEINVDNLFKKGSAFSIGASDSTAYATINGQTIESPLEANWNLVVMTYDGKNQKLFVNGQLKIARDYTGLLPQNLDDAIIGDSFFGTMDDVLFSKQAMPENQINDWYNNSSAYSRRQAVDSSLSANLKITGNQINTADKMMIKIVTGGNTATATYKTSNTDGDSWSAATYTTSTEESLLTVDSSETGLGIKFGEGATWKAGEIYKLSSWYTEPRSSSRGIRRSFPETANIISTEDSIEVFDAGDDSLWMRFSTANNNGFMGGETNISAIDMSNGQMWAASNNTTNSIGILKTDFLNDDARYIKDSASDNGLTGNIRMRNSSNGHKNENSLVLNNSIVSDLQAKQLEGENYILAGTNLGAAIINDNQDRIVFGTRGSDAIKKVALTDSGNSYLYDDASTKAVLNINSINNLTSDFSLENRNETYLGKTSGSWQTTYRLPNNSDTEIINDLAVNENNSIADGSSDEVSIATANGLGLIGGMSSEADATVTANRKDGFIRHFTNQYITENMNGSGLVTGMWISGDQTLAAVADRSDNNNDLTVNGFGGSGTLTDSDWTQGVRGKALKFGGASDYLSLADNSSLDFTGNNLTFGAWVKAKSAAEKYILAQTDGTAANTSLVLGTENIGSNIKFTTKTGMGSQIFTATSKEYPVDSWHMVVGVINSTNDSLRLYVDGQIESDMSTVGTINNPAVPLTIGWAEGASKYFDGQISGAFITKNAINEKQIRTIYQIGLGALNDNSDDLNQIAGTSNNIQSTIFDRDNNKLYIGTTDGVSEIDLNKDTRTNYWKNSTSPALPSSNAKYLSFGNDKLLVGTPSGAIAINTNGEYTSDASVGKLQSAKGRDVFTDGTYNYYASDKGLDVMVVASQTRKGYIPREEGFNSVTAFGGYVYMGTDNQGIWRAKVSTLNGENSLNLPYYSTDSFQLPMETNTIYDLQGRIINHREYLVAGTNKGAVLLSDIKGTSPYSTIFRKNDNDAITKVWLNEDGDLAYYNATEKTVCVYDNAINQYLYQYQIGDAACTRKYTTLSTPSLIDDNVNDLVYVANTSTALANANTLYAATDQGISVIQEHTTQRNGTAKYYVNKLINGEQTGIVLPFNNSLMPEAASLSADKATTSQYDPMRAKYNISKDTGLAGWWDFDQTLPSGVADRSGKNNNGSFGPGAGLRGGKFGQALYLDGDKSYLNLGDNISLHPTNSFSWEGWVWKDQTLSNDASEEPILVSKYDSGSNGEMVLYYNKNNKLQLKVSDGTAMDISSESSAISTENWHHLAVVFDNGQASFYVDGELDSTDSLSVTNIMTPPYNNNPNAMTEMYFGNDWRLNKSAFAGYMDETGYWTRVLSPEEIKSHYSEAKIDNGGLQVDNQDSIAYLASGNLTTASGADELMRIDFDENLKSNNGQSPKTMIETSWQRPTLNAISYSSNTNNNIVMNLGATGSWDAAAVFSPKIIKEGNLYKMWYTGNDASNNNRIGYATSSDGINWVKYPINNCSGTTGNGCVLNISSGKFDSNLAYSPDVVKEGNIYKMWYTGYNGVDYNIGYATSSDGINWTKQNSGDPVLTKGAAGSWDDLFVGYPTVLKDGTIYKMWYGGEQSAFNFRIGYATSTDGISWTKYDDSNNAGCGFSETNDDGCLIGLGNSGYFDNSDLEEPNILKINNTYYLSYFGRVTAGTAKIGMMTSANGIDWTKANDNNSVFDLGTTWDVTNITAHSIINDGNQLKMYYSGWNSNSGRIGLATMDFDPGRYGKSLYIGNNDKYIYDVTNDLNKQQGTISLWTKLDNSTDTLHELFNVFDGNSNYQDGIYAAIKSGQIVAGYNSNTVATATNTINNNEWNQVTISWSKPSSTDANLKIYINGNLAASGSFTTSIGYNYNQLQLGGSPNESREYLKGNLDDFRIYSNALTESEIKELYQGSFGNSSKINIDADSNTATSNPAAEGTIEFMYTPDWSSASDNSSRTMFDEMGGDLTRIGSQYAQSLSAANRFRIWKDEGDSSNSNDRLHFGIVNNAGDLYEIYTDKTINWNNGEKHKIAATWNLSTQSKNVMRLMVDNILVAGDNLTTGITGNKKKNGSDTSNSEVIINTAVGEKFWLGSGQPNYLINNIANGSMEKINGSNPESWDITGSIVYDTSNTNSKYGTDAISVIGPNTTNKLSQTIKGLIPGNWTLSWWSKGATASSTQNLTLSASTGNLTGTTSKNSDPGTSYVYNTITFANDAYANITINLSADSGETVWYDALTLVKGRMDENWQSTSSSYKDFKTASYALNSEELRAEYLAQTYTISNKNASLAGETNNVSTIAVKKVSTNLNASDDILFVGTKGDQNEGALTQLTFGSPDERTNEWRQTQSGTGLTSNNINSISYHPVRANLAVATDNAGAFGFYDPAEEMFVTMNYPNGSEQWKGGSTHDISWNTADNCDHTDLYYSLDGGSNYSLLQSDWVNSNIYSWNPLPLANTSSARVKVNCMDSLDNILVFGSSVNNFTIDSTPPTVTLNPLPNPRGDNMVWGRGHAVDTGGASSITGIEYSVDDSDTWLPAVITAGAGTTNIQYDFSTAALPAGIHRIWVRGHDSALPGGNESDQTISASQLAKIDELSVTFNQQSFNIDVSVNNQSVSTESLIMTITGYGTDYSVGIKANHEPQHADHNSLYIPFYTNNDNWLNDAITGFGWRYTGYNNGRYNSFDTDNFMMFKNGHASPLGEQTQIDFKTVIDWGVAAGTYNNNVGLTIIPKY